MQKMRGAKEGEALPPKIERDNPNKKATGESRARTALN